MKCLIFAHILSHRTISTDSLLIIKVFYFSPVIYCIFNVSNFDMKKLLSEYNYYVMQDALAWNEGIKAESTQPHTHTQARTAYIRATWLCMLAAFFPLNMHICTEYSTATHTHRPSHQVRHGAWQPSGRCKLLDFPTSHYSKKDM